MADNHANISSPSDDPPSPRPPGSPDMPQLVEVSDSDDSWESDNDSDNNSDNSWDDPPFQQRLSTNTPPLERSPEIPRRQGLPASTSTAEDERTIDFDEMPHLLSVSDSSVGESVSDGTDSDSDSAYDFGVANAAGRMAFARRRHPPTANAFIPPPPPPHINYIPDVRRAHELLDGLELVSSSMLQRYQAVQGEATILCAICHESLVSEETTENADPVETVHVLPCRHLFHTQCLSPWFGIKTTCPTCRFDLDPHSLTSPVLEHPGAPELERLLALLGQSYWANALGRDPNTQIPELDAVRQQEPSSPTPLPIMQLTNVQPRPHTTLLTPIASRSQTLELIPGEPFNVDQLRWPPGRSSSISQTTSPIQTVPIDPVHIREALLRRMSNASIRSPPTPHRTMGLAFPLSSMPTRVGSVPEPLHGTPATTAESVARSSTAPIVVAEGQPEGDRRPRRRISLSPLVSEPPPLSSPDSSPMPYSSPLLASPPLSPEYHRHEITPVAPLMGHADLPPVSPGTPNFDVIPSTMQDEADDDAVMQQHAWFDYLSPSHGIAQSPQVRAPQLRDAPPMLDSPEVTSPTLHSAPPPIWQGAPPFHDSAWPPFPDHTDASRQVRMQAPGAPRWTVPDLVGEPLPLPSDSFNFGEMGAETDSEDGEEDDFHRHPARPKWVRPEGQSFLQWIEEKEVMMCRPDPHVSSSQVKQTPPVFDSPLTGPKPLSDEPPNQREERRR